MKPGAGGLRSIWIALLLAGCDLRVSARRNPGPPLMSRVYWTLEARSRLRAIEHDIERDSPNAAKAVVRRILERNRQHQTVPLSGRRVPEYRRSNVCELLERPYRIIYRVGIPRIRTRCLGRHSPAPSRGKREQTDSQEYQENGKIVFLNPSAPHFKGRYVELARTRRQGYLLFRYPEFGLSGT